MNDRLEQIRSAILAKLPGSDLRPLSAAELTGLVRRYPDLPEHLRQLFAVVGVGAIGASRYMIHGLLDPDEVYDPDTAAALAGVVLVGDDFAGTCEAYDTKRGWKFGSIGATGEFDANGYGDFIDFLESWYGEPASG
jgi:hypothetical protein